MKVLVNGQLIEYKDEGKGKTVLLLHGWGSGLSAFDELAAALKRQYRVVRLDFPGFGASPKPTDEWGVGEYAQLTAAFLKKLNIKNPHALIGHSFGGRVIIKGFSLGVLGAEKVVMLGAAGPRPRQGVKRLAFKVVAKAGKAVTALPGLRSARTRLRSGLYKAAGSSDYLQAGDMQRIFVNTVNEDLMPVVHSIDRPVLMVWGEHDQEVPVAVAKRMRDQLRDAELVVVPDAGHFVFIDDPKSVLREIEAFL